MHKFSDMLEEFVLGKIDANTLHKQMKKLFRTYLKERRFKRLQYLKIYPFMSALQDEDLYQEHVLKKEINQIIDILDGKKPFIYHLWMKLEEREMSQIYKIWDGYKKNGFIAFEESELLQNELRNIAFNTKTIEDICFEKLLALLVDLPTTSEHGDHYDLLYMDEYIHEIDISENVEKLINILAGKTPVHILLKYVCSDCMYIIL